MAAGGAGAVVGATVGAAGGLVAVGAAGAVVAAGAGAAGAVVAVGGAGGLVAVGGTAVAVGVAPQAASTPPAVVMPASVKNWRRVNLILEDMFTSPLTTLEGTGSHTLEDSQGTFPRHGTESVCMLGHHLPTSSRWDTTCARQAIRMSGRTCQTRVWS